MPASKGERVAESEQLCAQLKRSDWHCSHGIGHGLVQHLGTDRIDDAMRGCIETADPGPCYEGAIMQHSFEVKADPSRPFSLCRSLEVDFKSACYVRTALALKDPQFGQRAAHCASVEAGWVAVCAYAIGRPASRPGKLQLCRQAGRHYRACLLGAVQQAVTSIYSSGDDARRICAVPETRAVCLSHAGLVLKTLLPEKVEQSCKSIAGPDIEQCLAGSRRPVPALSQAGLAEIGAGMTVTVPGSAASATRPT